MTTYTTRLVRELTENFRRYENDPTKRLNVAKAVVIRNDALPAGRGSNTGYFSSRT